MSWWALLLVLGTDSIEPASADVDGAQTWFFDVKIDGKDVGYHSFTTRRDGDGFDVEARAEFRYKFSASRYFLMTMRSPNNTT